MQTVFNTASMVQGVLGRYGLKGVLSHLPSERDDLVLVETDSKIKFIVRISAANELSSAIECQNAALETIAAVDPSLPVPQLLRSLNGKTIEWTEEQVSRAVLVFTYLEGIQVRKSFRPGETVRGRSSMICAGKEYWSASLVRTGKQEI